MADQNHKIRWGVLGYARIARESVIPAIQRSSNSMFQAVGSRDSAKLAECKTRFNVPSVYPSYDDVLRDPNVDAIYIPLPNALHCEWTIKAAEHGKHILCEKPIGLNAAECRRMIDACARHGVKLMEAFMYRYTHRTKLVIEVLRSGVLGEVKFIQASFRFLLANSASIKLKSDLGGGSLYDVGCYPVNFIGMIMDEIAGGKIPGSVKPESVAAECVRVDGVDMIFSAVLKYASGVIASLNCGFNAHKRVYSEIIGTQGVLEIPDTFFDNPAPLTLTVDNDRREIPVPESDRYRSEVEDFADAILTDRAPHFTLAETLRNTELIDRLFEAVK